MKVVDDEPGTGAQGGAPRNQDTLSPPPDAPERAQAELLCQALDPDRPAPVAPAMLEAELRAQARAAAYLFGARAITPALQETRDQLRRTLERTRRKLDALQRPRRIVRWKVAAFTFGAIAAAVGVGILLVPPAPPSVERRAYEGLFTAPFERAGRASERVERMLDWRRNQR